MDSDQLANGSRLISAYMEYDSMVKLSAVQY